MDRFVLRKVTGAAAFAAMLLSGVCAQAQEPPADQTIAVGPSPIVRIQARSAMITLRTADRPEIQISSTVPVFARRFAPAAVARALPGPDIPILGTDVQSPQGSLHLPAEDFPVDGIAGTPHDAVTIAGGDSDNAISVTVPAGTALVFLQITRGAVHVQNMHTALVARVHNGAISVTDSSGEAYLEAARGLIAVGNSEFSRVRARAAIGNISFENCNVRQIEVSNVRGNVAFDNGSFAPGLARFESQEGNIALGVASGGVQVGAHAGGRVVSAFDRGGGTISGTQNDAQARFGGGGPVVTVNAAKGNVLLYDGTIKTKPQFRRWMPGGRLTPRTPSPPRARTCVKPRCRV